MSMLWHFYCSPMCASLCAVAFGIRFANYAWMFLQYFTYPKNVDANFQSVHCELYKYKHVVELFSYVYVSVLWLTEYDWFT